MFPPVPQPWITCLIVLSFLLGGGPILAQSTGSLEQWQVSLDQGQTFQPIEVPGTVEEQIDADFDGVSIYKTRLPSVPIGNNQRLLLHFQAVATEANVLLDDEPVGTHLGGWTPFTIDITDEYQSATQVPGQECWITVVVDEKIGHNTQGFLPIVTNHFGGIWKPVTWEVTGRSVLLTEAIAVRADLETNQLVIETPVLQPRSESLSLEFSIRPVSPVAGSTTEHWQRLTVLNSATKSLEQSRIRSVDSGSSDSLLTSLVQLPGPLTPWTPDDPQLYEIRTRLLSTGAAGNGAIQPIEDTAILKIGFRTFATHGNQFLLNDQPIAIRGVLNWGYAPPGFAPSLDENWMRSEIQFAQDRGFNLMKFCLWVPPRRYLELCDEMGMLAWVEYPTWHPKLDEQHLEELVREYSEFFEYDRNHCSIVLRSLTCETGPSADLEVVQSLYDQCKRYIPDAVLEDDSSWIQWNRVHDFYDDHPYGNNHTWVATLTRLKDYIADRETQPLVLGEAIAADTWTVPTPTATQYARDQPAHGALSAADASRWIGDIKQRAAKGNRRFESDQLLSQSRHYGMLMRKFQIEKYHHEVPQGGYVVSVIRDFPKAAMGLIDFENRAKHTPADWAFQNSRMVILTTENDRRSFTGDRPAPIRLTLKNDSGVRINDGELILKLVDPEGNVRAAETIKVGAVSAGCQLNPNWQIPLPAVETPARFTLDAVWSTPLSAPQETSSNQWPLWIFPGPANERPKYLVHPSAASIVTELPISVLSWEKRTTPSAEDSLPILARRMDLELLQMLSNGRSVWMMPDGESGSFPLTEHWFLRGAPVAFPRPEDRWHQPFSLPREGKLESQNMLIELQHFDLAGPVIANLDHYLSLIDPLLLLWDNHDLAIVKTHGLVFEMSVGDGRMLVSTLNHTGKTNSAGRWLFHELGRQLAAPKSVVGEPIREQTRMRLLSEVNHRSIPLHQDPWRFHPDPGNEGAEARWFDPNWDDSSWSDIRVDQHWEGQGQDGLDGWAWYRRSYRMAEDWSSATTYLNFTGIDDYAVIYVNGTKVGTVGDLATQRTAFEDRVSFDVSRFARPGQTIQITVAVYDWYGAGGIFRPVTLSTQAINENPPILK